MTLHLSDVEWLRMARYLAGESNAAEAAEVERWIGAEPTRVAAVDRLRRAIGAHEGAAGDAWDTPSALEQFKARLRPYLSAPLESRTFINQAGRIAGEQMSRHGVGNTGALGNGMLERGGYSGKMLPQKPLSWALVGLLAIMTAVGLGGVFRTHSSTKDAVRVYQTRPGQRATVRLANGATMTLAPASIATISPAGVRIDGEASFVVAPQSRRGFSVSTVNTELHVLGTQFLVRHYEGDRATRVVVRDGKVMVQQRRRAGVALAASVVVAGDMFVDVADSVGALVPRRATGGLLSAIDGTLVFDRTPLRDVVTELNRAYGADIRVTDSTLANETIIAEFDVTQKPLTQVLDVIAYALHAHYTRTGNTFVVVPGLGHARALPEERTRPSRLPQLEKAYGR